MIQNNCETGEPGQKHSYTELFPRRLEVCVHACQRPSAPSQPQHLLTPLAWQERTSRAELSAGTACPLKVSAEHACQGSAANPVLPVHFPIWHQTSSLVWATGAALPKGDSLITVSLPPPLWSGCKTAHCWTWAIPRNWVSEVFKRAIYLGISPTGFLRSCLYNSEATEYFHSK